MMENVKLHYRLYAELIGGLCILALLWNHFRAAPPAPVGVYTAPKESPDVAKMEKHPMQGKINVLPSAAKHKVNLPQADQDDPQTHVVDTAQFPINYQPFTAVATYDEKTGDVSIQARNDPLPWLAAENRWYARIGGGVKTRSGRVGQLAIGGNVVQMKSLHIGGSAELFTDGDGYVGAHVEYQF